MDTLKEIHEQQRLAELAAKKRAQARAEDYLLWYSINHDWSEDDLELVIDMLGLRREPDMLTDVAQLGSADYASGRRAGQGWVG